jgi:hypothetical protein
MSEKYIGGVAVDSGQVMIVDPCYVTTGDNYRIICDATLSPEGGDEVDFACIGGSGTACAVAHTTRYGDGVYPVYADMDKEGRILSLRIVFADDENED